MTYLEPALHRPRPCPECTATSTAIVAGRCLGCREPEKRDATPPPKPEWLTAWLARVTAPPVRTTAAPLVPARCTSCGVEKFAVASDGNCLSCRLGSSPQDAA